MFDIFIAIDFSASNKPSSKKPKSDALWASILEVESEKIYTKYFRTRQECFEFLKNKFNIYSRENMNILVGYDFDFGFPYGFSQASKIKETIPWKSNWKYLTNNIEDNLDNSNNRFQVADKLNKLISNKEGPFYGVPLKQRTNTLNTKGCEFPYKVGDLRLQKKRICEIKEPKAHPVWKLLGTGSVGGQSLMGIPFLYKLSKLNFKNTDQHIWPFTTGFNYPNLSIGKANILHCEIWPGILNEYLDKKIKIKDKAQVIKIVQWFLLWQEKGKLNKLMAPPSWVTTEQIKKIIEEEGWVIGSGLEGEIWP